MSRIVVAAAIFHREKVLIAQRKKGDFDAGAWEFPGGARRKGESPRQALVREISEELGVRISVSRIFDVQYLPNKDLLILYFRCLLKSGSPRAIDCGDFRWVTPRELRKADLCAADRKARRALIGTFL